MDSNRTRANPSHFESTMSRPIFHVRQYWSLPDSEISGKSQVLYAYIGVVI